MFCDIENEKFDGFIIIGVLVEIFVFEEVDYWEEFKYIMEYLKMNVIFMFYICWGV